MKKVGSKMEER